MSKFVLTLLAVLSLFLISGFSLVVAKNDEDNPGILKSATKQGSPKPTVVKVEKEDTTDEDDEDMEEEEKELQEVENKETKPLLNTIKKMEKLMEQVKDPEDKKEVKEMTQNQIQIEEKTQEALQEMEGRPGILKFILGPDYKNAGEVRSNLVRLQNQERQMLKLRERLENEEDIAVLNEALNEVNSSMTEIKNELATKLSGFSLFGWLSKLLTGYEPVTELSPSPSIIPSLSPSPTATGAAEI